MTFKHFLDIFPIKDASLAAKAAKAKPPAPKGRGGRATKPKASDGQGRLF